MGTRKSWKKEKPKWAGRSIWARCRVAGNRAGQHCPLAVLLVPCPPARVHVTNKWLSSIINTH